VAVGADRDAGTLSDGDGSPGGLPGCDGFLA
jgi:hypothetical protein